MKTIDFTKICEKYKGLWVALADDEETVLGSGKSVEKALEEAKKGVIKNLFYLKFPPKSFHM